MVRTNENTFIQYLRLHFPAQVLGHGYPIRVPQHHIAAQHRRMLSGVGLQTGHPFFHLRAVSEHLPVEHRA